MDVVDKALPLRYAPGHATLALRNQYTPFGRITFPPGCKGSKDYRDRPGIAYRNHSHGYHIRFLRRILAGYWIESHGHKSIRKIHHEYGL
jgi:hypothetical protein